jgi:hypothetical protein
MSLRCEPIDAPSLRSGAPSLQCERSEPWAKSLKSQHLASAQLTAPSRTLPTAKSLKSQHLAATQLPPPPKGGKEGPAGGRPSLSCSSRGVM